MLVQTNLNLHSSCMPLPLHKLKQSVLGLVHIYTFVINFVYLDDSEYEHEQDQGELLCRDTKKAEFLFVTQPALTKYQLSNMRCEVIKARDGLELPAYLSLPLGAEPKQLPMILNVHGGPWARDAWGYRPDTQWFTNRGYAVLQVCHCKTLKSDVKYDFPHCSCHVQSCSP